MSQPLRAEQSVDEKPARVLVVDDDVRVLSSMQALLGLHGLYVETALGGRKAIAKLDSTSYDLVLLDLWMPEMPGHEVLAHITQRRLPVFTIVVSVETSADIITSVLRQGAHDYLRKPYEPDELIGLINRALNKKRVGDAQLVKSLRMKRSEKLHRFIVNNSPDIIFTLDENSCITYLNSRAETLLGYQREELLGRPVLALVEPADLEKAVHFFDQAMSSGESSRTIDIALKTLNGSPVKRYFEVALGPAVNTDELNGDGTRYRIYGTARDITDRLETEAFINFQAYHDLLTRLPNRTLFKDRLSVALNHARRSGERLAVMFIDLDRFKGINDTLGHNMGDRLLQAVAQRMMDCIRRGDTLSRFGGDEFTLLLPGAQSDEAAIEVAGKILAAVQAPFSLAGHDIHIGASIGICLYPDGGANLDSLIKNADTAMYRAKRTGTTGYAVFSNEMASPAVTRRLLEQEMRLGLQSGEFHILYQPQIAPEGERLVGVEALVRWSHPTHGLLLPSDFLPIAESSCLIIEIDRQILAQACREIRHAHDNGMPGLMLAVNFSPLGMERADFADTILSILQQEQFPPSLLTLETTESLLMNKADVAGKLQQLRQAGIQLAIDDFGTGASSLSSLRRLPVSMLKIDSSLMHGINSPDEDEAQFIDAIIAMGHRLKLSIVAEGVERRSQLDHLRSIGCDLIQGYLYGQPAKMKELLKRFIGIDLNTTTLSSRP